MNIEIAGKEEESTVTLKLSFQDGDEVLVSDKEEGWSIISFREVNGKLSLVRHTNIDDERFNLNEEGQIEEVDE